MAALLGGGGIAGGAEAGQLLDEAQLLAVTGEGRLGGVVTGLLERQQKLLLGFNILGGDDLHYLCLSLGLHIWHLFHSKCFSLLLMIS